MNPFPGLLFDAINLESRQRVTAWQYYGSSMATVYYHDHRSMRFDSFDAAVAFAAKAVSS